MKGVPLNEKLYDYIVNNFAIEDDILKNIVKDAEEKKIPLIQVSPELGKFLQILIKMISAKNILEIGTLTGYSSIWMARALPEGGKVTTLEISEIHANEAKKNFRKAGLENKIELILGSGSESLEQLKNKRFDFAFIDADKTGYPAYFDKVITMMNKGGIIAADNALRDGKIIDSNPDEGTRAVDEYNRKSANDPRVESMLVPISDGLTISWVK